MSFDLGKTLKNVVVVAAPVAATAVAGVEAGALVAVALGAGASVKVAGKAAERHTGKPMHKVLAPVAAISVGALGGNLVDLETSQRVCTLIEQACASPGFLGAMAGVLAWVGHALGAGASKAVTGRREDSR